MRALIFFLFFSAQLSAQMPGDTDYVFRSIKQADERPEVVYHLNLRKAKLKIFPKNLDRFENLKTLDYQRIKFQCCRLK